MNGLGVAHAVLLVDGLGAAIDAAGGDLSALDHALAASQAWCC
jgi:hypothetical protein